MLLKTIHLLSHSNAIKSSSAKFLRVSFWSCVSWCGTQLAATFLLCSYSVKIQKTEMVDMLASYAICLQVLKPSLFTRVLTMATAVSSIAATCIPHCRSSWILTQPLQKQEIHWDIVLWSTASLPQTSHKPWWIPVRVFPYSFELNVWVLAVTRDLTWVISSSILKHCSINERKLSE